MKLEAKKSNKPQNQPLLIADVMHRFPDNPEIWEVVERTEFSKRTR